MSFRAVNSSIVAVAVPPPLQLHHSSPSSSHYHHQHNHTTTSSASSSSSSSSSTTNSATSAMAATTSNRQPTSNDISSIDESSLKTPTRHSFAGIAGQKPLPSLPSSSTPPPPSSSSKRNSESIITTSESRRKRENDSIKSEEDGSDVEMEDAKSTKGSDDSIDDADGDGADGVEGNDGKSSKKKKGQRFFCSDFPPCNLSFTRSEHLARHIRKHTGERPFQCHCGRRFSRLDNLRQHAQTVHVNEDIPMDSLAANGTRFQRQIRTERTRPVNRSRSSTFTSGVPPPHLAHLHHHRGSGHSRNLSSSSIASMTSSVSTLGGDEYRRAPLGFETPRTNRLSLDTYTSSPSASTSQPYYGGVGGENSPAGYSTPNTFSHGNSSPRFSSGIHSPLTNNTSRSSYWATTTSKAPHRRLSMSGSTPFQSAHSPDLQSSAQHSPVPSHAALQRHSHYTPSPVPSGLDSPRDSPSTPNVDSEYRRHTWQPQINTQLRAKPRVEPNVLTTSHIKDLPRPVFPSLDQQQSPSNGVTTRLPGIHTFDQPPPPPSTLLGGGVGVARAPSPMHLDGPPQPTSHPSIVNQQQQQHSSNHQRGVSWTSGLQKDLNRLEITQRPTSWAPNPASVVESPIVHGGHSRNISDSSSSMTSAPATSTTPTARKNKRMGWYIQPPSHQQVPKPERPSPDSSDGAPTPITTSIGFQPAIVNQSNGHIEQPQGLGLSHVEEAPKSTLIPAPLQYHHQQQPAVAPPRPAENHHHHHHQQLQHQQQQQHQRSSLSARSHDRYSNPFGLQKVHEHAPAEHYHHHHHHAAAAVANATVPAPLVPLAPPPSQHQQHHHHHQQHQHHYGRIEDRSGLDALVAAATSNHR